MYQHVYRHAHPTAYKLRQRRFASNFVLQISDMTRQAVADQQFDHAAVIATSQVHISDSVHFHNLAVRIEAILHCISSKGWSATHQWNAWQGKTRDRYRTIELQRGIVEAIMALRRGPQTRNIKSNLNKYTGKVEVRKGMCGRLCGPPDLEAAGHLEFGLYKLSQLCCIRKLRAAAWQRFVLGRSDAGLNTYHHVLLIGYVRLWQL